MATDFDAVVVGSGFGGAVAACRLAEAGYKVAVLERGRWWDRSDYPSITHENLTWSEDHPERENGWLDVRLFGPIGTIAGAGVGGGSLHFANVVINARGDLFESGWPPEITYQDLVDNYYSKVDSMLNPTKVPQNQLSNRAKLMREAAGKIGFGDRYSEVDLAVKFDPAYAWNAEIAPKAEDSRMKPNAEGIPQGFCVHLGQCVLGCPVEARNTLALNYIPRAQRHDAEVRPLHVVRTIEPAAGGYRVRFDRIDNGQLRPGSVTGRIVIIAAGSVGSTELLLRCRDEYGTLTSLSPALGHYWCSNGNYLTPAVHRGRKVFLSRGPTISAGIWFHGQDGINNQSFLIEDGGVPDLLYEHRDVLQNPTGLALKVGSVLRELGSKMDREPFEDLMLWFAQGRDAPRGEFYLRKKFFLFGPRILRLSWDRIGARAVLDQIQVMHRRLAAATGGEVFLQLPDAVITPHPLGGCRMAATAEEGVVDHRGAAFGYSNLYIADGSIVPRAIGHNPSKTIAALSERIANLIIQENR